MSVPFAGGRSLPAEVLENIAFELVASTPLGNPNQLLPLLVTSKAIHNALDMTSGTALYSRICRLKFDVGSVTRRAFTPLTKDLNGHLVQMCTLLKFLRTGDVFHEDAEDQLLIAYVAMLDNDGKNRAQLEHAGIVDFVDIFVRAKLHEGKEENNGWPKETGWNACALWLMWMFSTRERLLSETDDQRREILRLVFPLLVCPHRYPSAIVPPNHFTLPLGPNNPVQNDVFTMETAHGRYPVYYTHNRSPTILYHFNSNPAFMEPLIAPVAALLFWSRRELNGCILIPPHLPEDRAARQGRPGLTQQDLREFNATKVAKLPPCIRWDWERGLPMRHMDDGTVVPWKEGASERWDVDWWRARLCISAFMKQPKFRLGSVYVRGMLMGLWQGITFGQSHPSYMAILDSPQCPPDLSERSTYFTSKPIWLPIREHGFVRTPVGADDSPIPHAPSGDMVISVDAPGGPQPGVVSIDVSLSNAWFPGPIGSVRWVNNGEPLDSGIFQDRYLASRTDRANNQMGTTEFVISDRPFFDPGSRSFISEFGGPIDKLAADRRGGKRYIYERYDGEKVSVHQRMVDAKECLFALASEDGSPRVHPGCARCMERDAFLEDRKARDAERMVHELSEERVDEIFQSIGMDKVSHFPEPDPGLDSDDEQRVIDLGLHLRVSHFPDDIEHDRMEQRAASSSQTQLGPGDRERPVSQLVPISSSPPLADSPHQSAGGSSSSSSSSMGSASDSDEDDDMDYGDDVEVDLEEGHPGGYDPSSQLEFEPVRRSHDRYRVESCEDGVEDVALTGEMDEKHRMAWGETTYYGRVRPWDGMVAILALSRDPISGVNNHVIYYGYIYGGDTFVGNWRYAAMDPLIPTFECGFIMSKKEDIQPAPAANAASPVSP